MWLATQSRLQYKAFCFLWNLCVILSIAWFIASIEFTIRWNDIRGVNTIDSTGQLIPFIVGCVSASQVMKKLMLFAGARVSHTISLKYRRKKCEPSLRYSLMRTFSGFGN